MCCFSRPVQDVSSTKIFARVGNGVDQFVAYAMNLVASEDLSMVLPIPVVPGSGEKAVKFISLEKYPAFFDDLWKGFPARVAETTGCPTVVYSRYGYGGSDLLEAPFGVDYMHREADEALPELIAKLGIERPILVGHSDGASIALIYTGAHENVLGLVALAPHVFVEDVSVRSIEEAKVAFETTEMPQKLARHHADARRTFYGWNDIWLHPDFRRWNIEACLPRIRCPVLVIQGLDDEYGTMAQIEAIAAQVAGRAIFRSGS